MNKIWHVYVHFEDFETTWFSTIGHFTKKSMANEVKDKWENIFSEILKLTEEPIDWNPKLDDYYQHPYYVFTDEEFGLPGTYKFTWTDSKQYEDLLEKYDYIRYFRDIQIEEYILDEDIFLKIPEFSGESREPLKNILITLERDWKLKQITE